MGGEQSRDMSGGGRVEASGGGAAGGVEGEVVGGGGGRRESDLAIRPTSTSPRPSISSDADLPYISYTVNRPIGDSPKHTSKGMRGLRSGSTSGGSSGGSGWSPRRRRRYYHRPQEVVVVREATTNNTTQDSELARLQNIPTFLPIMRGALTAPSARDPEVLERLDCPALLHLTRRYQLHLHTCAQTTTSTQDALSAKIREIDGNIAQLVSTVTQRQRQAARQAEKLNQVSEVSHALTRCHASLNQILEGLDTLNAALPINERLNPFVWTTG